MNDEWRTTGSGETVIGKLLPTTRIHYSLFIVASCNLLPNKTYIHIAPISSV